MLKHEDNERLVRVGPGTPMGALLAQILATDVAVTGTEGE